MAITVKNIVARKHAEVTQTTQYTAPSLTRVMIDKFTVTNTGAATATLSVNLVVSGGSAAASNRVVSNTPLIVNESYTCPELVGQILEPGGFISTIASVAATLTISASGREIT